jgi:hypothetical protein
MIIREWRSRASREHAEACVRRRGETGSPE